MCHYPFLESLTADTEFSTFYSGAISDFSGIKTNEIVFLFKKLQKRAQFCERVQQFNTGAPGFSRMIPSRGFSVDGKRLRASEIISDSVSFGTVSTREELIGELRGIEYDGFDRSVDICISRLRRKLEDDATQPVKIKTLRGVGYLLTVDGWSSQT